MIPNLGNSIQLFVFMFFIGLGSYLGQQLIGGNLGAVLGAAVGILARYALGFLTGGWPPCSCGNDEVGRFDLVERPSGLNVWKCQQCGASYTLQRREWVEVLEDDTRVPRLRQGLLGRWKAIGFDSRPIGSHEKAAPGPRPR
jgi:hypothetical protein